MSKQAASSSIWPAHVPERWRLSREEIWRTLRESSAAPPIANAHQAPRASPASAYVTMRDGVRLAIDVWTPPGSAPVPAIAVFTRYWRSAQRADGQRMLGQFARKAALWNEAGYALVVVDVRGAGASFGVRSGEYSPEEIRDFAEIVDWVAAQPWSDGFVATEGGSYSGNAAELAAVHAPAALKAAIPSFTDFDSYQSIACPGGAPNLAVMQMWGAVTYALDRGMADKVFDQTHPDARIVGPMPVDDDSGGALRNAALVGHAGNFSVSNVAATTQYADDRMSESQSRETASIYAYREAIEAAGAPQLAWASWMDAATADGLLARFMTFERTPIRAIIGAWSHLGLNAGDPVQKQGPLQPADFMQACTSFLNQVRGGEGVSREIKYYVIGADVWRTTSVWPPRDVANAVWRIGPDRSMSADVADTAQGHFDFSVSGAATTGTRNRWHTQLGGGTVVYPSAYDESHRLCFASMALGTDVEIVGHPVVDLHFACDRPDAVVHAYLESVSEDGVVTHLAEGVLRAAMRRVADGKAPYTVPGPYRTFRRGDAEPLTPGEVARLTFRMLPIAARVPAGHRLQLALAGADNGTFARYPDERPQHWRIHWGAQNASQITLPIRRAG